ncbi:MAG: RNA methyltransferase [Gemmatimonadota bacterium]|nr:RNA methyltransferase [Gemmatimonadota bacterium]MDH5282979.1 RNA methyltransferase [Gemmatimonadota bacterium]
MSLQRTIRDLHRRRGRERRGLALAEGIRLVEEALAAHVAIQGAAVAPALETTPRGAELKRRLAEAGVPLEAVTDAELVSLADTEHPQGVVAVVSPPAWKLDQIVVDPRAVVVVLDGVQDPGNVGAVCRTALAFGAAGVIALPGTADLWNPKALRGSMGALFRLPALHLEVEELADWTARHRVAVWATGSEGRPVSGAPVPGALALVLGNEGAGITPALAVRAAETVSIPLRGGVESLNVAVAAGILLHEVTRDR